MKPTDDSRLMNRLIDIGFVQLFIHIKASSLVSYRAQTFVSLSLTAHDFSFLSPTVQDELSRQPRCQPLCSASGYPIQSNFLFNQAFLSTSDHFLGSISNPKDSLDHLVSPGPSRSSALHGASCIPHYAGLLLSHEAERPRPCRFICRHHYLVAIEG